GVNTTTRNVNWGDFDMDNDLDLLVENKILENTGSNSFEVKFILEDYYEESAWIDINNDGYLDAVVNNELFLNHSADSFTHIGTLPLGGSPWVWSVISADVDQNGTQDIISLGSFGCVMFKNNGDLTFEDKEIIWSLSMNLSSLAVGDYNNDGFVDLLISARNTNNSRHLQPRVYKNNGLGSFAHQSNISLKKISHGDAIWFDYDTDGDLDIVLNGDPGRTKIYNNNGNNPFTEQGNTLLPDMGYASSLSCGDLNNDGYPDLFMKGGIMPYVTEATKIFFNNQDTTFTEYTVSSFVSAYEGSIGCGDYDMDGDLDFAITNHPIYLYENTSEAKNNAPTVPLHLTSEITGNTVSLSWDAAKDDNTPEGALSYNVRIGSERNAIDIVSPLSLQNGQRQMPARGNAQLNKFYIIKNLPVGTYYYSVQAIDNGYLGSAFAHEQSFTITEESSMKNNSTHMVKLYPNPTSGILQISAENFFEATVYSIKGELLISTSRQRIDLSNLPTGTYIVKLVGYKYVTTQTIVVQ
ncbi:MAG: T9SS type A sorting domain-containing protein, partial [Bacteroidales bacterium]|nr:T9SS type A sorting domain-containing protein [Bacteroidales bacterium]